ncbi:hypothetical protein I547_1661 [Mycobacterium kansasii 824]|nr:hypothetical protein I547_1661 [Mycobacterium kansasii 824]
MSGAWLWCGSVGCIGHSLVWALRGDGPTVRPHTTLVTYS